MTDTNETRTDEPDWDSVPCFPFDAWDLIAQRPVAVTGWATWSPGHYRIEPGVLSKAKHITTVFPQWYVDAQQALSDARDEADTQQCALDVGVQ